jgi:hypothetical protein
MSADELPPEQPAGEDRIRETPLGPAGAVPAKPDADAFDDVDSDIRRARSKVKPEDENYLRLLSIFHFVVGAIAMLCSSFFIFYLVIGIGMVTGSFPSAPPPAPATVAKDGKPAPPVVRPAPPPPPAFGWMFVIMGAAAVGSGYAFAAGLFTAGVLLRRHRGYIFCFVMAGLACTFQPFGIILGIFTIIVLMRPGVKELFGRVGKPSGRASRVSGGRSE